MCKVGLVRFMQFSEFKINQEENTTQNVPFYVHFVCLE